MSGNSDGSYDRRTLGWVIGIAIGIALGLAFGEVGKKGDATDD